MDEDDELDAWLDSLLELPEEDDEDDFDEFDLNEDEDY